MKTSFIDIISFKNIENKSGISNYKVKIEMAFNSEVKVDHSRKIDRAIK